ncbi:Tat (twin-arginine translocation) pathway signal sequence, partial [Streptomyces sp. DvalAA-14]
MSISRRNLLQVTASGALLAGCAPATEPSAGPPTGPPTEPSTGPSAGHRAPLAATSS